MRRAALATALGVSLLFTACANADEVDQSPPKAPPESVAPPEALTGSTITDPGELQSRMLVITDLPDGFSVLADPVRDLGLDPAPEYDAPDRSGTDPEQCGNVLAAIGSQAAGASAEANVRYSGPDFSSIDEDAASYPEDGAAHTFTLLQDTLVACTQYSGTDADGTDVEYSLTARDQPTIGDASSSFRLETTSEGFTLVSEVVFGIVDHTVFQLSATSRGGVDSASLNDLAQTAADRIRGGLGA